ncbi:biotin synthase BioB [Candidatus Poribacteria bacterium]|nr:biotin synthase BioB [Candidatus Poribacteria bacterium]
MNNIENLIFSCQEKALNKDTLTSAEANDLFLINNNEYLLLLMYAANKVRRKYKGNKVDLCALVNAKSGMCSEDCKFCAQSSHYSSDCKTYPFMDVADIVEHAKEAKNLGVHRFCIVTSGAEVSDMEFEQILKAIRIISGDLKMEMDCSLGHLTDERMKAMKEAGAARYNHNLETSADHFPEICTTHTFNERLETVSHVKEHGMERCCGGIIGMGETYSDRIKLAFTLKEQNIECVPINLLNPRPGTPLENVLSISPFEILKTIAIFRLILPISTIKVAGGREHNLRNLQAMALLAGANGMIVNGYLTTTGRPIEEDIQMLKDLELEF